MSAEKEPLSLPTQTIEVQVRFSDTDMMGHISSMSYGRWTEVARHEYFLKIPEPPQDIPWFVMVHVGLDFHAEGRFGQRFEIKTRCIKIGNKSLHLKHDITADNERVCTVTAIMSGFDRKTRQGLPAPSHWRASH